MSRRIKDLKEELQDLSYSQRWARIRRLVCEPPQPASERLVDKLRHLVGGPAETTVAEVLDELCRDAPEYRVLGLFGRTLLGQAEPILAALSDPSQQVRRLAARWSVQLVDDDAVLADATIAAPPSLRARLVGQILRCRRTGVADLLLPAFVDRHLWRESKKILPMCSESVVRSHQDRIPGRGMTGRLAKRHPDVALQQMEARLSAVDSSRWSSVWSLWGSCVDALAQTRPGALLTLIEQRCPPDTLPGSALPALGRLAIAHPDRVTELFTAPLRREWLERTGLPLSIRIRLRALPGANVDALARALHRHEHGLTQVLLALPPSRREAVFDHAVAPMDRSAKVWGETLIRALPHTSRHREAKRMASLRTIRENHSSRLQVLSYQPFEEACEELRAECRGSRAEHRQQGWRLFVSCAGLSRCGLDEVLEHTRFLRNEQDPVRLHAYQALARLPIGLFQTPHVPVLTDLVRYALEARDTSYYTRTALKTLSHRMMCAHAEQPEDPRFQWAIETLRSLAGQSGAMDFPPLDRNLRRGAEQPLVDVMLPWLEGAAARNYSADVTLFTTALGKRAWAHPGLQDLLWTLITHKDGSSASAVSSWLADPSQRDARVRRLLDLDASAGCLPPVFKHLHTRRQEWLNPYLSGARIRGYWSPATAGWVPDVTHGFHRWSPPQQHRFAETLRSLIADTEQNQWVRTRSVRALGAIPQTRASDLQRYVASDTVAIAEAALGALVWLDQPAEALPILLEHLDSDRARVAMYAIPRMARLVPSDVLATTLRTLLGRERLRVTVHKEVLRLIGVHRIPDAGALLAAEWSKGLHRDVRIAALHAARSMLDQPGSWSIIEAAAASDEPFQPLAVLDAWPGLMTADLRSRYLGTMLRLADHADDQVRRQLMHRLQNEGGVAGSWLDGSEGRIAPVAARILIDEPSTVTWRIAANVLTRASRDDAGLQHLEGAVTELLARVRSEDPTPSRELDLPHRQRLQAVLQALAGLPRAQRPAYANARAAVTALLEPAAALDQGWTAPSTTLWSVGLPREGRAQAILDRLGSARSRDEEVEVYGAVCAVYGQAGEPWTDSSLLGVIDALLDADASARTLALRLVAVGGHQREWAEAWRLRLGRLRNDPDGRIRAGARRTLIGPG